MVFDRARAGWHDHSLQRLALLEGQLLKTRDALGRSRHARSKGTDAVLSEEEDGRTRACARDTHRPACALPHARTRPRPHARSGTGASRNDTRPVPALV